LRSQLKHSLLMLVLEQLLVKLMVLTIPSLRFVFRKKLCHQLTLVPEMMLFKRKVWSANFEEHQAVVPHDVSFLLLPENYRSKRGRGIVELDNWSVRDIVSKTPVRIAFRKIMLPIISS
jgi:hypothetical protein